MSNLQAFYIKILSLLHELEPMDNFFNQTRVPKTSNKALIALALAAESVGIDSERYLFKQLPNSLIGQIERSVYNRRRRQLGVFEPFNPLYSKARKRIEALFSQLCEQFKIRRNYAKSFTGFATRILSKITALTMIQWINLRNGNNINNLKIVLS